MLAMAVDADAHRLVPQRKPLPPMGEQDVLVRVLACGVCRTDLHLIDAELPPRRPGVVPGHEVVGEVVARGARAMRFQHGQRVGIPWLGHTCGQCDFCRMARENLCDAPSFTGWDRDGGYAEYCAADERFCLALPGDDDAAHAAPLLCAGLIGFRSWRIAGGTAPRRLGIWGFGAAAHIVCQLAVAQGQQVYAFTRAGDTAGQAFARQLGAAWAGASEERPPVPLDASLIFAPAGPLVPAALALTRKGGVVVCGGIHMSPIPAFDYALLWGERELKSVANLTREDGEAFYRLLEKTPVRTHVQRFALAEANVAVAAVRGGRLQGAAVLIP
ncbi:zinc-dependent alcohol dehydrogenase family protein [Ramlibacter tataouinensis]|uniref:Alcohol dehydrogenase n=1 Tax=Ramlibacter tataouinensis TaxID=94132 RepID=A0A127K005_9BURK|nr:zinc-dependent alcohol dehydrogenase family protein [Ramlibacter tataouinensis]AMO25531.1 alcohol dehydrogenase [Ramlibacter tataouinensis]